MDQRASVRSLVAVVWATLSGKFILILSPGRHPVSDRGTEL